MGTITLGLDEIGVRNGAIGTLGVSQLCWRNSRNAPLRLARVGVRVGASCTLGGALLYQSRSMHASCDSVTGTLGVVLFYRSYSMHASLIFMLDCVSLFKHSERHSCSMTGWLSVCM